MPRSRRSFVRTCLGLVFIGAGIFLLLELSARVYLFGMPGLVPKRINSVHGLHPSRLTRASEVEGLAYELRPNLDDYFKLAPFQTNSDGLRDREYTREKPADTVRVAVVGSSFALPAGVAIERAFHSLLEERLSSEFAPVRYEFINFSVGMYSPENLLSVIENRALAYEPDLILFTVTKLSAPWLRWYRAETTRPKRPPSRSLERAPPNSQRSYPALRSFLVQLVRTRTGEARTDTSGDPGLLEQLFISMTADEEPSSAEPRRAPATPPRPQEDESVLVRLARIGERAGVPIVLVRLDFEDTERSPFDRATEDQARAAGIHYFDTRSAFRGTVARDFWIFELDPHPNDRAHEIFADAIATFLRAEGLLTTAARP